MKHYTYSFEEEKNSLQRLVPDLFTGTKYKTILNIGASDANFRWSPEFKSAGYEISVAEHYKSKCERIKKTGLWLKEVICINVTKTELIQNYDIIFWWSGPEHLLERDIKPTIKLLEAHCNKVMILACPWGKYITNNSPDGAYALEDKQLNPEIDWLPEGHNSHNDYTLFEEMGYTVECLGIKDSTITNMISVKYMDKL
jgi:hypothetical protein